jgi:hypothetical protein
MSHEISDYLDLSILPEKTITDGDMINIKSVLVGIDSKVP